MTMLTNYDATAAGFGGCIMAVVVANREWGEYVSSCCYYYFCRSTSVTGASIRRFLEVTMMNKKFAC